MGRSGSRLRSALLVADSMAAESVRLRDARSGRISGSQLTDTSGFFSFTSVDPGTYVVELTGKDQTVLAASQLLSVSAGDAVSAVVKLPFKIPPFAGLLGHSQEVVGHKQHRPVAREDLR